MYLINYDKDDENMYCMKCGNFLGDNSKFCGKCGTPVNPVPQNEAPQQNTPNLPYYLYMDAKGLTLLNYNFEIKSADGVVRYRAATVTESMITYNARIYYPNNVEALIIRQQKKMTFAAMNFDIFAPNGALITEVLQTIHFSKSEFNLPNLGITVTGDFFSIDFQFTRGNQTVAVVRKKVLAWGDCYELEIYDPNLEQILLATIMVIQIVIAASRKRRRR